jgi:hypothetical protein
MTDETGSGGGESGRCGGSGSGWSKKPTRLSLGSITGCEARRISMARGLY